LAFGETQKACSLISPASSPLSRSSHPTAPNRNSADARPTAGMALHHLPMHLLLNKRIGRTFLLAVPVLLLILFLLAGFRSSSTAFRDNARDRLLPSWLNPSSPTAPESEPEFYPFETASLFNPVSVPDAATAKPASLCASFPSYLTAHFIQPVLKLGHGEPRDRVEAHLDSVSACFSADELLVFGDLDEEVGGRGVIDVLADLPASYYREEDNPDFAGYVAMREMRDNGTLDKDAEGMGRINGWKLDKYKFLPGIERAWTMRPGRDWYFFYETDTYVVWDNLFRFLGTLDPSREHYIGSPSPGRVDETKGEGEGVKTWFANGGPGYVLSRAAVEKLLARRVSETTGRYLDEPLSVRWLDLLRRDCCGDSVIGWMLWAVGVKLEGYWPLFNPHPMHGVPYSDLYWCQPVVTLHKTRVEDMVELWRWEQGRRRRDVSFLFLYFSLMLRDGLTV